MLKKISFYFTTLFLAFSLIGSAYAVTLKASHQWPGTPRADGSYDPRHEMVLEFILQNHFTNQKSNGNQ